MSWQSSGRRASASRTSRQGFRGGSMRAASGGDGPTPPLLTLSSIACSACSAAQVRVRELTERCRELEDQLKSRDGEIQEARLAAAAEQDRKLVSEMQEREERLAKVRRLDGMTGPIAPASILSRRRCHIPRAAPSPL